MNLESLRKYRNEQNLFARYVGISITEIRLGWAKAEAEMSRDRMNPIGSVHGGFIATMADCAAGAAASSYGIQITTMSCNLNFLRPGLNVTHLVATAKEIKHGSRISVYSVRVMKQDGVILTEGTFTFMTLSDNPPILREEEE